VLLCSDGLSDLLDDEDILAAAEEHAADLDRACQALVDRANAKGGDDNITVLMIQAHAGNGIEPERGPRRQPTAQAERGGVIAWLKRTLRGPHAAP
jgi:serine/threonine protein phosphatase PrpC